MVAWADFSSDTKVVSWSFDFICCSTWANCTSCWVNWLVSSGSSGFWFLSCVVSNCRKVVKLLAIMVLSSAPETAAAPLAPAFAVAAGVLTGVELMAVMVFPQVV